MLCLPLMSSTWRARTRAALCTNQSPLESLRSGTSTVPGRNGTPGSRTGSLAPGSMRSDEPVADDDHRAAGDLDRPAGLLERDSRTVARQPASNTLRRDRPRAERAGSVRRRAAEAATPERRHEAPARAPMRPRSPPPELPATARTDATLGAASGRATVRSRSQPNASRSVRTTKARTGAIFRARSARSTPSAILLATRALLRGLVRVLPMRPRAVLVLAAVLGTLGCGRVREIKECRALARIVNPAARRNRRSASPRIAARHPTVSPRRATESSRPSSSTSVSESRAPKEPSTSSPTR